MIKKVKTEDLKVGIYVMLGESWLRHSFLKPNFKVTSEKQIKKILHDGIKEVKVDTSKSEVIEGRDLFRDVLGPKGEDTGQTRTEVTPPGSEIVAVVDDITDRKRADEAMHNLIEIIHFAEHVSTKIHGLLDEAEIYRTVKEAFVQSKSYTASLLLLTDDDSSLRIAEASLSAAQINEGEKATGLRMKGYKIDLKKSSIYSQVVREGKTVQAKVSDIIGELFPRPLAYLISKTTGFEKKSSILTPLKRQGKIIGAFAMTPPELAEYFVPSVRNLAQHISNSLEWADEYRERERAEKTLRESEDRYRTVIEDMPALICRFRPDGTLTFVNSTYCQYFGKKYEELVGHDFFQFIPAEDREKVREHYSSISKEKPAITYEHQVIAPDSTIRWQRWTDRGLFDESGALVEYQSIGEDITERERAEEALRESEERFRDLAELLPETIYEMDTGGNLSFVNRNAFEMFKYTQQDFDRGLNGFDMVIPEDRHRALENAKRILGGEEKGLNEYTALRKDGSTFPAIFCSTPIFREGKPVGFRGLIINVTERKRAEKSLRESEEKYRTIFENVSDHIVYLDNNGTIISANYHEETFGRKPEELVGKKYTELGHFDVKDVPKVQKLFKEIITGEKTINRMELEVKNKDGNKIPVEVSTTLVKKNGTIKGILCMIRDITERKQAEEEIQRRTEDLALINDLNNAIEQDKSLKEIINLLSRKTKRLFSAYGAAVYLISEDKKFLTMVQIPLNQKTMQRIEKVSGLEIPRLRIPLNADGLHREVVQEKKVLLINDQKRVLRWMTELANFSNPLGKPYPKSVQMLIPQISKILGIRSTMVAPLISEGEIIGLLEISGQRPFIESDLRRLEILSRQISTVIKRKRAEEELKATQEKLRNLSTHLQSVIEEERTNIAREIHDELAQALTALQIDLYWLGERIPAGEENLIQKINSMSDVIETVIQSTQRISTELRPVLLDTLGLSAAIEWQVEEFQKRTGIQCEVVIDSAAIDLDPDRSTAIFRILQESLTNVARHADATEVRVGFNRHSDKLILEVVDNGKGITQDQISSSMAFGLIGMRERIRPWEGEFNISGINDKGTTVIATISLDS